MIVVSPEERKEQRVPLKTQVELLISRLAISQGPIAVDAEVTDLSRSGMKVHLSSVEEPTCRFLDEFGCQRVIRLICKLHDAEGAFRMPGTVVYCGRTDESPSQGCILGIAFDDADYLISSRLVELAERAPSPDTKGK